VIAIPTGSVDGVEEEKKALIEETVQETFAENGNRENSYERKQELRLKEVLQQVDGVGKAEVMITLQASAELVIEKDTSSDRQRIEEEDAQGGSRLTTEDIQSEETIYQESENGARNPYVVKQMEPKVEGVIVIAQGGDNPQVKQNILEAVQALFSVEAHKIKIMKMEGSK